VTRAAAALAPFIEIRPMEVQLATWSVLLRRDRSLSRELAEGVAMHPEVLGGVARIQPLVKVAWSNGCLFGEPLGDALSQLRNELLEQARNAGRSGV
jgi:hypothetical protein